MAVPTVRGFANNKKTGATSLVTTFPSGSEAKDLAVLIVTVRNESELALATPETNGVKWTLKSKSAAWQTVTTQRKVDYFFVLELNNSPASVTVETEAKTSASEINTVLGVITKGTFNTTKPINVESSWVEEGVTEPKLQAVTTTVAECLALFTIACASTVNGFPPTGTTQQNAFLAQEPWVGSKTVTGAESSGHPEPLTKSGTGATMSFTFAVAPVSAVEEFSGAEKTTLGLQQKTAGVKTGVNPVEKTKASYVQQVTGLKEAVGTQKEQVGFVHNISGLKILEGEGAVTEATAFVQKVSGQKIASGGIVSLVDLGSFPAEGEKWMAVPNKTIVALSGQVAAVRTSLGGVTGVVGLSGKAAPGIKQAVGKVTGLIGFLSGLVGHGGEEIASGPATGPVGFVQRVAGQKLAKGSTVTQMGTLGQSPGTSFRIGSVRQGTGFLGKVLSRIPKEGVLSFEPVNKDISAQKGFAFDQDFLFVEDYKKTLPFPIEKFQPLFMVIRGVATLSVGSGLTFEDENVLRVQLNEVQASIRDSAYYYLWITDEGKKYVLAKGIWYFEAP